MTKPEQDALYTEACYNNGYLMAVLDLQTAMKELHAKGTLSLAQGIEIEQQMFASLEVQKLNKFTPNPYPNSC